MRNTVWDLPPRMRNKVRIDADSGCWLWVGALQSRGYGCGGSKADGMWLAHRRSYELLAGPIAPRLTIDHLCRTPRCINPAHLEVVTMAENLSRAGDAIQETPFYPCGHPRTPENTRLSRRTGVARVGRICLECSRRASRQRRKAAGVAA